MQFSIQYSQNDWSAFNQYITIRLPKTYRTWLDNVFVMTAICAVFAMLLMLVFGLSNHFHTPTALAVGIYMLALFLGIVYNSKLKQKAFLPSPRGVFVGIHHFRIDETGINSSGSGYQAHHEWHVVHKIERIDHQGHKLILVYLDTFYAFIFPENQLDQPDAFYEQINHYFQTK